MATVAFGVLSTLLLLAGSSHATTDLLGTCKLDMPTIVSSIVRCITEKHPEYLMIVLTRMDKHESLETMDFMCSNPKLMAAAVECGLNYLKDCLPSSQSVLVGKLSTNQLTVARGIEFVCNHKEDFMDLCFIQHVDSLAKCIDRKAANLQDSSNNMLNSDSGQTISDILCLGLVIEEQCLAEALSKCPAKIQTSFSAGLLSFFNTDQCHFTAGNRVFLTDNDHSKTVLSFKPH